MHLDFLHHEEGPQAGSSVGVNLAATHFPRVENFANLIVPDRAVGIQLEVGTIVAWL